MSIYDDYPLSDDGLRCPDCGRVDCECYVGWRWRHDPKPVPTPDVELEARQTTIAEREARGEYE